MRCQIIDNSVGMEQHCGRQAEDEEQGRKCSLSCCLTGYGWRNSEQPYSMIQIRYPLRTKLAIRIQAPTFEHSHSSNLILVSYPAQESRICWYHAISGPAANLHWCQNIYTMRSEDLIYPMIGKAIIPADKTSINTTPKICVANL